MNINQNITELGKVGKATASRLAKLNIATIYDILMHFPFRYENFTKTTNISDLECETNVNIVGEIDLIQNKKSFKKKINITEALIKDSTGSIKIIWFNQPFIAKNIKIGDKVSVSGKIDEDKNGYYMSSPIYEKINNQAPIHTQGLVPIYPTTHGLTQKQIRFIVKQSTDFLSQIEEWLPQNIKDELRVPDLTLAIKNIHFPKNDEEIKKAQKRLSFDEMFLLQLESVRIKASLKQKKSPKITFHEKETKNLVSSLPFSLTNHQRIATWDILKDISKETPMSRILAGDVGSGKTIVSIIACYNAFKAGYQSVVMAPTEILAIQHFDSFKKILSNSESRIGLITRTKKTIYHNGGEIEDKKTIIAKNADILIGTHAIIQDKIKFSNLGLTIIDEQHRFGVDQRKKIKEKSGLDGLIPHFLSMTATPIPRTMALALYGDLEVSTIKQMPKGRRPILTKIVDENKRTNAYDFIKNEISKGRQAFVVCPLIDPSDKLGIKSVKEEFEKLNKFVFPDIPTGIIHGKLKTKEKEGVMNDFKNNKIKILVSTSVVEVGVDVPNANIMIIEGAERFGLSQLHQFRGRIGRGEHQSYCLLFSESRNETTRERLEALTKHSDGFELSKIDLEYRGPGEVFGMSQSGFPELKFASIFDFELIQKARSWAEKLINEDPSLNKFPSISKKIQSYSKNTHLE